MKEYVKLLIVNLIVFTAFGLFLEIAYRGWMAIRGTAPGSREQTAEVTGHYVFSHPFNAYNEQFGYDYVPGDLYAFSVSGDESSNCHLEHRFDADNKAGDDTIDSGKVKIQVFGDSMMAFPSMGSKRDANIAGTVEHDSLFVHTVPSVLQGMLRESGYDVDVINHGRDGYGILQMMDLAAEKTPLEKPDLAIFVFITDDLTRARFWRSYREIGPDVRSLLSNFPDPNPSLRSSNELLLTLDEFDPDLCRKIKEDSNFGIELARGVHAKYRRIQESRIPSLTDLNVSYLYNRLRYGSPQVPYSHLYHHTLEDYRKDQRFRENVRALKEARVPVLLVHLAIYPEFVKDVGLSGQQSKLLDSLMASAGLMVEHTKNCKFLPSPLEAMNASATDYHPSFEGMKFHAKCIMDSVERTHPGILEKAKTSEPLDNGLPEKVRY